MQPIGFNTTGDVVTSASLLSTAREAFYRSDFDACLEQLGRLAEPSPAERCEANLLRARTLIRTQRFAEVVALLGPALDSFVTVDEACTARMLHGAAVSRTPDGLERGQALLEDVASAAETLRAHRAIRGEIAYMLAFVHWMKREHRLVLRYALLAEKAHADVISVRAASLRGYVAEAEERYPEALRLFHFALDAYRTCRERDADLLERIVVQIAALETALRSAAVGGTHALPAEIGRGVEGTASGPGVFGMETAALDAWLFAFDGDRRGAYRSVRVAHALAPDDRWRVWVLAHRAKISAAFEDLHWAAEFAAEARELSEGLDWNATDGEERLALLHLAEALAQTDPLAAVQVFERYEALTSRPDRALLLHDDVRLWILEEFVRGLVLRARGDMVEAWRAFKGVHEQAKRVGLLWRATLALIELDATPVAGRPRGDCYLQTAALLVRENFPRSFLARRLGRWALVPNDPVAAGLARQPREVLREILTGKNPKEIAAELSLSEDTVKHYVKTLFGAFGVHSTPQLIVACYRRGIGDPTWWSRLDAPNPPPIAGERAIGHLGVVTAKSA
jgi:DNA-binding CsgD family transcriptional regulator/tetratricopeptide (TPR) repeat protein